MTARDACLDNAQKTSHDRLVEAVFSQWQESGGAAMSARRIAAVADAPVSSIYHHFGSLERLFLLSQEDCLKSSTAWCEGQLEQIREFGPHRDGFPMFFAHIVDDWARNCRPLAFAWRECQILARRTEMLVDAGERWRAMWHRFWARVGEVFDLGQGALIVERIFDSESMMHLIRWRSAVDRAALDETARGLAAWLGGTPAPAAPWREFAHAQALRSVPSGLGQSGTMASIQAAAAQLLGSGGVAGVTHRAVAELADVTLGTVSHKFATKSALLEAAFEGVYANLIRELEAPPMSASATDAASPIDNLLGLMVRRRARGGDEMFVAAARDPSLSAFGAQLRYLRGRSSRAALQGIMGWSREASVLEGALFSAFLSSQLRRNLPSVTDAAVQIELGMLINLLLASR